MADRVYCPRCNARMMGLKRLVDGKTVFRCSKGERVAGMRVCHDQHIKRGHK